MFKITTVDHGSGQVVIKPFTWSYSRLKSFETCPKRHWHEDIAKDVPRDASPVLDKGNDVHIAIARYLTKDIPIKAGGHIEEPLAAEMRRWCDMIKAVQVGQLHVEQKLGMTRELKGCAFFAKDVWYRGVSDVTRVVGPVAAAVDWKTGKVKEDGTQLALMAACIMAHYPEVQKVRTEFVWLEHNKSSRADFARSDMTTLWAHMLPRIAQLETATKNSEFPAKPGGLCKGWCPVKQCAHWSP